MNLNKNIKNNLIIYYLIGLISFLLGYLVFILVYYLFNKIYLGTIAQYISIFILKYYSYTKYIFRKLSLIKYLFFLIIFLTLNNLFLYVASISIENMYILQLMYLIFTIPLGFFLLKYLNYYK